VVERVKTAHAAGQSLGEIARALNADRSQPRRGVGNGGPQPSGPY
jgi:hypothetical protein